MDSVSVLLVDDNPILLRIVSAFLQGGGDIHILGTAGGCEEALAQARELRPEIILFGLGTRGVTGFEAISRLRSLVPASGIIVLGLFDTNGYRQAAMEAGADDFISKATISSDLLPAISRVRESLRLREKQPG
ncbi:MAG: response regulator transcription factor [Blastocatellia bacterium]|nr:response regulator transcription factor [Blastocatellia bacterium]